MANVITNRSRKEDILAAYKELRKERDRLAREAASAGSARPSSKTTSEPEEADPMMDDTFATGSVEAVITGLATLRSGFGESVGALQHQLTGRATALAELRKEADEHVTVLADLHHISTVADDTLLTLVDRHKATRQAADTDHQVRQAAFTESIEQARKTWDAERTEHQRTVTERNNLLTLSRKREAETFEYDRKRKRDLDNDTFAQTVKLQEKELEALEQEKQRAWEAREKELADQEKELAELESKAKAFPDQLEAAVQKARDEGVGIARRQARVKSDLVTKENEGRSRVYELRIHSLEQTLTKQRAQIQDLSAQLNAAMKQAQELAVKAIEGASNATSFQAVKEIALEQAKTAQKSK